MHASIDVNAADSRLASIKALSNSSTMEEKVEWEEEDEVGRCR